MRGTRARVEGNGAGPSPPHRLSRRGRAAMRRGGGAPEPGPAPEPAPNPTVVGEFVGMIAAGDLGASGGAPIGTVPDAVPPSPVAAAFGLGTVERPPPAEPPVDDPPAGEPAPRPLGKRARRIRRRRRLVAGAMLLSVGLGTGLAVVGWHRVRNSTAGHYVDPSLRPDEPGYVAMVTPTPTMLVLQKGALGQLVGVALLGLQSQGEGGSVVLIPTHMQAPFARSGTTLADVYATNGAASVTTQLELSLNLDINETVQLDDAQWKGLVTPVGSVSLVLRQPVGSWPAGRVKVAAAQVGSFLSAQRPGEAELARLDRQEMFWTEWLPLIAARGRSAVPGETDVGLGRFVRGLAAGPRDVTSLPVSPVKRSSGELFAPEPEMADQVIAAAVPYPQEPSVGSRVRIRLLNGTQMRDLAIRAAPPLVKAGAEIALSGNGDTFHETRTRIIYSEARLREKANSLRDALGVGVVEKASGSDADTSETADEADRIDVTVVLGADAPAAIRRLESSG